MARWQGVEGDVGMAVQEQNRRLLETYEADPRRLEEDANTERSIHEGAYAKRQLFELVQNAADAMREGDGRCEIILAKKTLYVANSGAPLGIHGVETLMAAHLSAKRDEQIGRFGLGFKSVLAVTDTPRIFSLSGSLAFDRDWSRGRLARAVPGQDHYPVARLAQAIDPVDAKASDSILSSLMEWASTVVVLPQLKDSESIADDMRSFPKEFLLFSPHVTTLGIEDRVNDYSRHISVDTESSGLLKLEESGKESIWTVTAQTHSPSSAALKDGGYQAARSSVEVSWAAPVGGAPRGIGIFWAYFPTGELTTLSGITNAPWKLADDRESLLAGAFNDELLTAVLPKLVVKTLPKLADAGRATTVIDLLPARGKEARGHADNVINQPIYDAVSKVQCIPTATDGLRHPTRVKMYPDAASSDDIDAFLDDCPDPENWAHPSLATNNERRSKVLRLLGMHSRQPIGLRQWVEHLAERGDLDGSAAAVKLVSSMSRRDPTLRAELTKARVLLLEDATLGPCLAGQVFLPGGVEKPGQLIINPVLASMPGITQALNQLGIQIFDHAGELRAELSADSIAWDRVWTSSRKNSVEDAEEIFRDVLGDTVLETVRVRSRSGKWRHGGMVFLPGEIIPEHGTRDSDWVVDPRFHYQDLTLLERLGLVDAPMRLQSPPEEPWVRARKAESRETYRKRTSQPKLADERIQVDTGRIFWPLEFFPQLSSEARHAITKKLLLGLSGDERWRITRANGGKSGTQPDPVWDRLARQGILATQAGLQKPSWCLESSEESTIEGVDQPLPFLIDIVSAEQASRLHIKESIDDLPDDAWQSLLQSATGMEHSQRFLLYAWAAFYGQPAPEKLRVLRQPGHVDAAPESIAVTHRESERDSLLAAGIPTIFTSQDDADVLVNDWGLSAGEGLLEETVDFEPAGEATQAIDRFAPLRLELPPDMLDLSIQPCKRISLLTSTPAGQKARSLTSHLSAGTLLTTAVSDSDVLKEVARETGLPFRPHVVLRRMEEHLKHQLRKDISEADDLLEKLVLAIGVEALKSSIPQPALEALSGTGNRHLEDLDVARLALAMDGYAILSKHSKDLVRQKLDPPSQWAGRRPAREWARRLGFPVEYAGFASAPRDAEVEVEGPPVLGDLHDYQEIIANNIRHLVSNGPRSNRGLVSLPTGAGKTRVVVQALVEHMIANPVNHRVVWVAETDELCEQAIQTWSLVWRAHGDAGTPMTLSRLWAQNEANERDGYQVVVTSISKLDSIIRQRGQADAWETHYGWLKDLSVIVVDEAHRSISPQYTRALAALGGRKRVQDISTPLIGLTATPFRGFNNEETKRLARRYDETLLDDGAFPGDDVYGHLQEMRVLARIRQVELKGSNIELTSDELDEANRFGVENAYYLPDSVSARLGKDSERNGTILKSVLSLDARSKVLLFATSVENARVLAALMTFHGVEARDVSSDTSKAERRQYIEDFKAGRIRVLTNYNVFTEGFDVPSVDAVYITRPTFSPNIYQQMIGRGLRGPLNGGSEEVLIVNVADNLTNFGTEFAFHHFDHLWKREDR